MKKLIYMGLFLLFCLTTLAQSPLKFGYQAVLRDANGTILDNENLEIEIDILVSEMNGDVVFTELHDVVSDDLGIIKLDIGSINSLAGIDWSSDNYFIRVYANGSLMGTSQLLSVPFAMHAQTAANVFSGDYLELINAPDLSMYLTGIDQQSLGELYDVDLTNLGDNKILKFNEAEGKWTAVDVAAASESDPVYSASEAVNITDAGSGIIISVDERSKLDGIETGAQVNVNADWNATEGDAMIINKPVLANVATSGSYDDLSDKPVLFDGAWDEITGKPDFANVAISGAYGDLSGTPDLSTVAATGSYDDLLNKPALFDGEWDNIDNKPVFADVATSGNYNHLTGTPDLSIYLTGIDNQSLGDLLDVDLTNISNNQILKYNAVEEKWMAIDVAAAAETDPIYSVSQAANITNAGSGIVMSSEERAKLDGIEAGAQVNVNADWNAIEGDAMIINKPILADVATSGAYGDLSGTPSFATVASSGQYSDLFGTPALSTVASTGSYDDLLNTPAIFDGEWDNINNKPAFADIATSGAYDDLSGTPSLATVATSGQYSDLVGTPALSTVASTGSYDDLLNKPALFDGEWDNINNKPAFADIATSGAYSDLSGTPSFATVASSGQYSDLFGTPALSIVASTGSYDDLLNKPALFDGTWASLSGKPSFATVANTGDYNDLLNKPVVFSGSFNDLTNKPTTLAGYGITNAMSTTHAANSISSTNINNWNIAYSWGNHAGLYRSSTWTPTWSQVSGKPSFASVATSGNYNDLSNRPNLTIYATKDMGNQNITNLADPVNVQDAATKAYVDLLESRITQMEEALLGAGLLTVKDGDGNEYSVVEIGGQYWLGENLKTTKLNDGTSIANVPDVINFIWTFTPAFAWYNNSIANKETYGALYNYYTVETGNICPVGWHVPTASDWDALIAYLGGIHLAGGKLKETGTATWISPNTGATNETNFTARPAGMRFSGSGTDTDMGYYSYMWSTEGNPIYPSEVYTRELGYFKSRMDRFSVNKNTGASIRCIKD